MLKMKHTASIKNLINQGCRKKELWIDRRWILKIMIIFTCSYKFSKGSITFSLKIPYTLPVTWFFLLNDIVITWSRVFFVYKGMACGFLWILFRFILKSGLRVFLKVWNSFLLKNAKFNPNIITILFNIKIELLLFFTYYLCE